MREKIKRYFMDYKKALENLKEAVEIAQSDIEIDGTIKRFELCYELVWKLIKEYLADEGIVCKSPRDTFREAHRNGIIDDEYVWMEMIDDRNILVHTYEMENARKIFERIKERYVICLEKAHEIIKKRFEGD